MDAELIRHLREASALLKERSDSISCGLSKTIDDALVRYRRKESASIVRKAKYFYVDEGCGWSVVLASSKKSAKAHLKDNDVEFDGIREATDDEVDSYICQRGGVDKAF